MIKELWQSNTIRLSSLFFSGNFLSQLTVFIAYALFSRFFPIDAIGIYTVFISLTILFSIMSTGRYESAIQLPKNRAKVSHLVWLSLGLALLFCILLFLVLFLSDVSQRIQRLQKIEMVVLVLPIAIFLLAGNNTFYQFFIKIEKEKWSAYSRWLQQVMMLVFSFVIANFLGYSLLTLVVAWVVGLFASFLLLFILFLIHQENDNSSTFLSVAKEYIRYPSISLPGNVINTYANELPNYFIPLYFGADVQTLYAYGNRVAGMPRNLIAAAVGDVFYKAAGHKFQDSAYTLYDYAKKISLGLFVTGVSIYLLGILLSDFLFPIVFDESYIAASPYFKILAIASLFLFVQSPISTISDVIHELGPPFFYNIINVLVKTSLFVGGSYLFDNPIHTIALYAVGVAIMSSAWIYYLLNRVKTIAKTNK